uniref:Uncharacterized mitochondrial protein AtMg00860-like n=1 Tax=Nicotiana tabacum TaxID=4097 RepID=A0A1S3XPK6_TOBAC|nr:PREDICTED: uncharacterized mitochondrial protein AtMg00860-like [Nicotiana tabacum]
MGFEDGINKLRIPVFDLLRQNSLVVIRFKCQFGQNSIDYLGHIISADGLQVDLTKIKEIDSWTLHTSVKDVRGFLGLTGYYRHFVKGYALLASPLTDLLKKDAFKWSDLETKTFTQLKQALSIVRVLRLPNFAKHFSIETNASGCDIGSVLSQEGHPIAFLVKRYLQGCRSLRHTTDKDVFHHPSG